MACQRYEDCGWVEISRLWQAYNRHLAHVIRQIPEAQRNVTCKIGADTPVTLGFLAHDYVSHLEHHLAQVERTGSRRRGVSSEHEDDSICFVAVFTLITAIPLGAQAPKGWLVRADRSTSAADPDAAGAIKFSAQGAGFHAVTPQAAVFWNPANVGHWQLHAQGTFTLVRPSNHTNYYGLVFGGSDLEGPKQTYLYFLVAQDGSWLIKQRVGDVRTNDVARAVHRGGQDT